MSLVYIGNDDFEEQATPAPGKTEWGVDTLTRIMQGGRPKQDAFIASLNQGDAAPSNSEFKLQSWSTDDSDPIWGHVTLNYKGLLRGIPPQVITNAIVEASGSSSAYFEPPYDWGGDEPVISAVMDYSYYAGQTTYKYITIGQPSLPANASLGFGFAFVIKKTRITLDDGTIFGGNAPVGIVSRLSPGLAIGPIGFTSNPIFGTPYFECEDIVRAELVGA